MSNVLLHKDYPWKKEAYNICTGSHKTGWNKHQFLWRYSRYYGPIQLSQNDLQMFWGNQLHAKFSWDF